MQWIFDGIKGKVVRAQRVEQVTWLAGARGGQQLNLPGRHLVRSVLWAWLGVGLLFVPIGLAARYGAVVGLWPDLLDPASAILLFPDMATVTIFTPMAVLALAHVWSSGEIPTQVGPPEAGKAR